MGPHPPVDNCLENFLWSLHPLFFHASLLFLPVLLETLYSMWDTQQMHCPTTCWPLCPARNPRGWNCCPPNSAPPDGFQAPTSIFGSHTRVCPAWAPVKFVLLGVTVLECFPEWSGCPPSLLPSLFCAKFSLPWTPGGYYNI